MAREIPHKEWRRFFDQFSRDHVGWLTTVEIIGIDIGDETEVSEAPLVGIAADKGGVGEPIEITVGELTHMVEDAATVIYDEASGAKLLEILSADGDRVILRLRAAERRAGGKG